jgi:hypothetical protein
MSSDNSAQQPISKRERFLAPQPPPNANPHIEEELFYDDCNIHDVACLYTIWSIKRGAARKLVLNMLHHLKTEKNVRCVVTLSPYTDMAKRFHLSNGAFLYRENELTVNYEYHL